MIGLVRTLEFDMYCLVDASLATLCIFTYLVPISVLSVRRPPTTSPNNLTL